MLEGSSNSISTCTTRASVDEAAVGLDALHALHGRRHARDRALVDGRAAAEGDFDLAAGRDAGEMQFVDVGQDAQLAHVDDLGDAGRRDTLALAREDLHHDAVERRADERVLAGSACIVDAWPPRWRGRVRIAPDRSSASVFASASLAFSRSSTLPGGWLPSPSDRWATSRSQALEGRQLVVLDRRFQGGFLQGDLGDAGAHQHLIVRRLELGQGGLGDANADIGGGIGGKYGDDLVTLDVLAVLDAQLDQRRAAQGIAGNDHRSGRRFGIAARDQRAGRAGCLPGRCWSAARRDPQAQGRQ